MQNSTQQLAGKKMTNHAKKAFFEAEKIALRLQHSEINKLHLLYAIYLQKGSLGSNIMKDLGVQEADFQKFLANERLANDSGVIRPLSISNSLRKVFTRAYSVAKEFGYPFVGTEHLTFAIFDAADKDISEIMSNGKITDLRKSITNIFNPSQIPNLPKMFDIPEMILPKKSPSKKIPVTPFIDKFCVNINKEVLDSAERVIGREKEIQRMIDILGRKNKNNPILIGEAGVGKTALISGLAIRMNTGKIPRSLYRKKIMSLDVAQLIAGTSFRGEFESRLKEILKEMSRHKNIILFIDEIHTIVGTGNIAGGLDLANIIKPALARGDIQLIGATTFSEYKKHIEKDSALERRFQPIQVAEPSRIETKKILFGIRKNYESFHNVTIADDAIETALDLSIRYIQNRFLPDKAIDVIDEAASTVRSRNKISDFLHQIKKLEDAKLALIEEKEVLVGQEKFEKAALLRTQESALDAKIKNLQKKQASVEKDFSIAITATDIISTISNISRISMEKLSADKGRKIKNIRKNLAAHIIGQDEALAKINGSIMRSQSGVGNPERPLGSFLFLGPTGVGKTLTAKILAQEFFDSAASLIRIDMSELMERHSVASLIGSPAGYIGYGEGGRLTEQVRRNPYSVILFDEIEKAHPDVFNILLQILEDGMLTDTEGTQVSFKNTIIILTSNIGTSEFTHASEVGFESNKSNKNSQQQFNEIKDNTIKGLEKIMRPELLNRLDHILVFNALTKQIIAKITTVELRKLADRLTRQQINFVFKTDLVNFITEKSLSFNQGARFIRKNIQELLENQIAEMIIYEKVKNNKISASVIEGEIKLS